MKMKAQFKPLDINKWERGEVFYYFSKMAPTGYSITVDIDVTKWHSTVKESGCRFFPSYLWLVTKTLKEQKEFKIAVVDGQLGYYNTITPLYATFHDDTKTFSLMWTQFDDDFRAFHEAYVRNQTEHGANHGILSQKGMVPPPNAYTVSCLPWVSFKHFATHSYDNKPYYFPSLEAGRLFTKTDDSGKPRLMMPLSITCHHAATDGWNVSRFLKRLQHDANGFEAFV